MIWSTYHVFGSGSAGVSTYARKTATLREVLAEVDRLAPLATDDGDNGFVGTMSVPDEIVDDVLYRTMWSDPGDPGPSGQAGDWDGFVLLSWSTRQIRQFVEILPNLTVDGMEAITHALGRNVNSDRVVAALGRRKAIIAAIMA